MPDVTVIGAGPAGSVAALLLARAHWNVTLIEQHRFPRRKVCGECLSATGIETLERLGMLRGLLAIGPARLTKAIFYPRLIDTVQSPLPRPMLGISRDALDGFLLDQAANGGARILQPARVEAMDCGPDVVQLRVRDTSTNLISDRPASWVLVADGKSAFPGPIPPITGDLGIKCRWAGIEAPRDAIELLGCKGCYGGLAPIEDNQWNMAFSVPAPMVKRAAGKLDAILDLLLSQNPVLKQRLRGAHQAGDWIASPLPRFAVRQDWPARTILVGNAAAAIEPIGGEGMGLAMRSAELAANLLIERQGTWSPQIAQALQGQFRKLWHHRQATCRAGAIILSRPRLSRLVAPLLRPRPRITRALLQLAGK